MQSKNITNSKPFIFAFAIGISIYLFYIYITLVPAKTHLDHYDISSFKQEDRIAPQRNELLKLITNPHCGRFPMLTDLNVSDTNWQVTNTSNGTFYLYNAYFDDREALKNKSVIRILALINKIDVSLKAYCQLWYEGMNEPIPVKVQEYLMIWPKYWGTNEKGAGPYLMTCPNPLSNVSLVPQFVSFVEDECGNANNIFEIRNKRPKNGHKENFLISVKSLDFQTDISLLLVEWCEILKIFGVNKIEIFIVNAHPNVIRVLKMYQAENLVAIKYLKFPHELPNKASESWHQWTQNDLIPYHDSFYENLYQYEYMIPMDVDEFIVPRKTEDRTWTDLLTRTIQKSRVKNETFDAFPTMNMYFVLKSVHENETIPGIPKNLRFLSSIYRAANFTPSGGNAKTFMRMDRVLTVHNHFPFSCLDSGNCKLFDIRPEDGHLAHYRTDCDNPECKLAKPNPTKDTTLWKYKDELLKNVKEALQRLKEFKSDIDIEGLDIKLT
ncbi:hypothetical protein ACKWTF_016478 [Chironomus riparius]